MEAKGGGPSHSHPGCGLPAGVSLVSLSSGEIQQDVLKKFKMLVTRIEERTPLVPPTRQSIVCLSELKNEVSPPWWWPQNGGSLPKEERGTPVQAGSQHVKLDSLL